MSHNRTCCTGVDPYTKSKSFCSGFTVKKQTKKLTNAMGQYIMSHTAWPMGTYR